MIQINGAFDREQTSGGGQVEHSPPGPKSIIGHKADHAPRFSSGAGPFNHDNRSDKMGVVR